MIEQDGLTSIQIDKQGGLAGLTSIQTARCLLHALLSAGITDVVCAPGSRSAPLLLTLAAAETAGQVRLHVRIDERSAGYLALGLAKASGRPVAVVTTSGTAAVNLHPAMVEASYAGVPLVALTADRPAQLRGSGANQTIDQRALFGVDARWWCDVDPSSEESVRDAVRQALKVAVDADHPGPVHLNIPLSEPLVGGELLEPLEFESIQTAALTNSSSHPRPLLNEVLALPGTRSGAVTDADDLSDWPVHGLIVVGDMGSDDVTDEVPALSRATGWPIIAESSANLRPHLSLMPGSQLPAGPLLLTTDFARAHVPDVVLTVGRVGLHRAVSALLAATARHIAVDVHPGSGLVDPALTADLVVPAIPQVDNCPTDPSWHEQWERAARQAARAVGDMVATLPFSAITVTRIVADHALSGDLMVVGPSNSVRHLSNYSGALAARVLANRGTSGIDGVISTAWGAAVAHGDVWPGDMTYALLGDITALYDRNGLMAAPGEQHPRLTYVVVDNDGGGIFSSLEQGTDDYAVHFERVFGTPHGGDLTQLLAAPGVTVTRVEDAQALSAALRRAMEEGGVHVVVAAVVSRAQETEQMRTIQRAVNDAVR